MKPQYENRLDCKPEWSVYPDEAELEYPRFLYLLGLAYELKGDTQLAVDTYLRLWQEAPESGYALLAREKLIEKP